MRKIAVILITELNRSSEGHYFTLNFPGRKPCSRIASPNYLRPAVTVCVIYSYSTCRTLKTYSLTTSTNCLFIV